MATEATVKTKAVSAAVTEAAADVEARLVTLAEVYIPHWLVTGALLIIAGYGHMSRDCTQGQKCYNCDESLDSPLNLQANGRSGGEVGHLSRDCPTEASSERVCYKCKQPGHIQSACPA